MTSADNICILPVITSADLHIRILPMTYWRNRAVNSETVTSDKNATVRSTSHIQMDKLRWLSEVYTFQVSLEVIRR